MNEINEYINETLRSLICGDIITPCDSLNAARKVLIISQIGIFSFFALTLLALFLIYFSKSHELNERKEKDLGLLMLGLFFTLQVVSAIFVFINLEPDTVTKGILSILNSGVLLYSIRYFDVVRNKKYKLFKILDQGSWFIFALILPVVTLILTLFIDPEKNYLPDAALSIFIFLVIAIVLLFQFKERNALVLSAVSVFACFLIIETQIYFHLNYKAIDEKSSIQIQNVIFNLLSLISLSSIGTIFLALAYTWVFEEFDIEKRNEATIEKDGQIAALHLQLSDYENKLRSLYQKIDETPLVSEELGEAIPKSVVIQTNFSKKEIEAKILTGSLKKNDVVKVLLDFGNHTEEIDITDLGLTKTGLLAFAVKFPEGITDASTLTVASKGVSADGRGSMYQISRWKNIIQDDCLKKAKGLKGKKLRMFKNEGRTGYVLVPTPEWKVLTSS